MKKFKYLTPQIVVASCLFSASALCGQTYIDEQFDYSDGQLGSPWVITYGGIGEQGTAVENVEAADTLNSYTPSGKQAYVDRPSTGTAGAPVLTLATDTASPVTNEWTVTEGDMVQLTFDVAQSNFTNGSSTAFQLKGGSSTNVTFFGMRIVGTSVSAGKFQVMTTGSTASFTDLLVESNPVSASIDTWYRVTYLGTIGNTVGGGQEQTYDLQIEQLGTGGGIVYSGTDLSLTTTASIGGPGGFASFTGGVTGYRFADVNLAAVPEPEHSAAMLMGLAGLAWLMRKRFFRKSRG